MNTDCGTGHRIHTKDGATEKSVIWVGSRVPSDPDKVMGGFPPTCRVAAGEACQGKPNPTQGWAWGGTRLGPQQGTVQGGIFGSGWALELGRLDIAT